MQCLKTLLPQTNKNYIIENLSRSLSTRQCRLTKREFFDEKKIPISQHQVLSQVHSHSAFQNYRQIFSQGSAYRKSLENICLFYCSELGMKRIIQEMVQFIRCADKVHQTIVHTFSSTLAHILSQPLC